MRASRQVAISTSPTPIREGAVLVEFALVISVFAVFLAGIIEFGHAYLVIGSMTSAARSAARLGTVENVTTTDVEAEANRILGAAFDNTQAVIRVKNAGVFDSPGVDPSGIDFSSLPDCEVSSLESGQMFLVEIEVPYADVAVMPPFWTQSLTLRRHAVVRHE